MDEAAASHAAYGKVSKLEIQRFFGKSKMQLPSRILVFSNLIEMHLEKKFVLSEEWTWIACDRK